MMSSLKLFLDIGLQATGIGRGIETAISKFYIDFLSPPLDADLNT
jgi:hypothetical protein